MKPPASGQREAGSGKRSPVRSNAPEVAPYGCRAPQNPDECTAQNADHDETRIEEDETHEPLVDCTVSNPRQQQSEESADNSLDEAVDEKRRPYEPIRCPDEPHDRDLARSSQH